MTTPTPTPTSKFNHHSPKKRRRVATVQRQRCDIGWTDLLFYWKNLGAEPPNHPPILTEPLSHLGDWIDKSCPPSLQEAPFVLDKLVAGLRDDPTACALVLQLISLAVTEGCTRGMERIVVYHELITKCEAADDPDTTSLPP